MQRQKHWVTIGAWRAFWRGETNMTIVHIEHPIRDFASWKAAFDSDPIGRERSGVRRYQIFRPVDDSNYVMVDLEFDHVDAANEVATALRKLWERVETEGLIGSQQLHIVEVVESKEYQHLE
jgi:hypothetical protein